MSEIKLNKSKYFALGVFGFIACIYPEICKADVGLPMIYLGFPFMLVVLVPVILIECLTYKTALNISLKSTLLPVGTANLISTIVGYPLAWTILLALELLTTHGSALGVATSFQKFLSVTLQSAWLFPYEKELYWMVPVAGLVGLIPTFFISVYLEAAVVRRFWRTSLYEFKKLSWKANLNSYALLAFIILSILIFRLIKHTA